MVVNPERLLGVTSQLPEVYDCAVMYFTWPATPFARLNVAPDVHASDVAIVAVDTGVPDPIPDCVDPMYTVLVFTSPVVVKSPDDAVSDAADAPNTTSPVRVVVESTVNAPDICRAPVDEVTVAPDPA